MIEPGQDRDASGWFVAGLFLTTFTVLLLELLDSRLLSIITWYHLSFFAVSMAMFGMAAGAVHVYLGGARYSGAAAPAALASACLRLAVAIPVAHVVNLCVPIRVARSLTALSTVAVSSAALAWPFYLSGVVVAIALTRIKSRIGLTYAADLAGAALGAIAVIPLLRALSLSSAVFVTASVAALGAACFERFAAGRRVPLALALAGLLLALGLANESIHPRGFRVLFAKERLNEAIDLTFEGSNEHSTITARSPELRAPFFWGAVDRPGLPELRLIWMHIDGLAGTGMTEWNGDVAALAWAARDVTSLPYHLRREGDVAIIGVGGARDVLTALWARSRSVLGLEINSLFLRLIQRDLRSFAGLADRPEVELVHTEARSYLTRTPRRFDVLQMSLIDTWAATGAGAFTLTENGLYTLEGFGVLVGSLKPGGLLSVSRFFAPERVSETRRLVALATATLLERGIEDPSACMALLAVKNVATLLVSNGPLSKDDLDRLERTAASERFEPLLLPGRRSPNQALRDIVASRTRAQLEGAVRDANYDYTPPTDDRPFFFNMLKPRALLGKLRVDRSSGGAIEGNLTATATLLLLAVISSAMVVATIQVPLARAGLPPMSASAFAWALLYFASIGGGFMFVQIPYLQRFSVFLGHPTFALAVVLFSMILFAGIGSWLSDRVPAEARRPWLVAIPLAISALLAALTVLLPRSLAATIHLELAWRILLVIGLTAPVSLLLGTCFPIGLRLVARVSPEALPWMWGVNGAVSVLASVLAVAVSMWWGIRANLLVAMVLYGSLCLPALRLWRAGDRAIVSRHTPPLR